MHIIDPSFRVLDDLDQASLPVRIESPLPRDMREAMASMGKV